MNFTQLKYFNAVCTYQTVSAAAEYLHISQPSLSAAIKELERDFGVTLFQRHHRGMMLTPEGELFYKMSKDLLNRAEQLEHIMNDLGKERKVLRLGVPPMIGSLLLPYIYREFLTMHPDISLEITEGGRDELLSRLSEDFLDMVFLPHNRPIDPNLSALKTASLEIVCCAAKNNPILINKEVSASDLANTPLVLFKNSFFQTEEIKKWFAVEGIKPNILLQTAQLSTVESIISNNTAVGFLFRPLIESNPALVAVPTRSPIYVDVSLVWKKDAYFLGCMKEFKEYINGKNPFNNFSAVNIKNNQKAGQICLKEEK